MPQRPRDPIEFAAPAADAPLIARDLTKRFRVGGRVVTALDAVSLVMRPSTLTGLIGPDGAGKTTLMRLTAGLLVPDAGSIQVLGWDATRDAQAVQSAVGYMPQRFGLYEDLSVRENLELHADLRRIPRSRRAAIQARLMEMTGLAPFLSRLAGRLSGGMKQKLGLACVLLDPPRLLLLDEPTVGVDPVSRRELWRIVQGLVEEGTSVLLSTAYLDEAERCAEVILLHQGRLVDQGPPSRFSKPLRGRVFRVPVDPAARRGRQVRLSRRPEILDAVPQGDGLRVVLTDGLPPDAPGLAEEGAADWEPVVPRFEDAFVALLDPGRRPRAVARIARQTPSAEAAIEVEDLSRSFGDFLAVQRLSFSVGHGEIFGLLGANGAGKTTTFRMLCGLLPASGGRVRVAGVDLRRAAAEARGRIGYVSQRFSLYTNLSVRQNLAFFAGAYGLRGRAARARIDWALNAFELEELSGLESGSLPLGYKQRLAMAAALMHEPDILFLDEPTSGVDPLARREFWTRIGALAESGVTVLVTTHFMEEAEYCDRLAIMVNGALLALGTPSAIKARAATTQRPEPDMEDAFIALIQTAGVAP